MIGTHNSMTYLKPTRWWMYPFRFIARCQKASIQDQYEKYGIRLFDLRIQFKDLNPSFAHGIMSYKGDVYRVIEYLNSRTERVYVRLILENCKDWDTELFRILCHKLEEENPNISFFGGYRKKDWKKLYDFKYPEPRLIQLISSMTGSKWDGWCPWLYAKLNNKKNIKTLQSDKWYLLDFINIQ